MALTTEQQTAIDALWDDARKRAKAGQWTQADADKLKAEIERIKGMTIAEAAEEAAQEMWGRGLKPSPYVTPAPTVRPAPTARPPTPTLPTPTPTPTPTTGGRGEPWGGLTSKEWVQQVTQPATEPWMPWTAIPLTTEAGERITAGEYNVPPSEPWLQRPPGVELPSFEIPEEYMPQPPGFEGLTAHQLMQYVSYVMATEVDKAGMRIYDDATVALAIERIQDQIEAYGFGPHIPFYSAALNYYGGISLTEAELGGERLAPQEVLDYQLSQQQLALQQQLANLPYMGLTANEQAQMRQRIQEQQDDLALAQQQLKLQEQQMWLPYEEVPAGQAEQLAFQREQMMLPYGRMTAFQEQQVALEKQRYGAQLAAQPKSWLEYSAYMGEEPVVQPWMKPLMPQAYGQVGVGQPIPGYQGTEGMAGMPQLTTPSRQYQARIGPTSQQQYLGYEQARTGAPTAETEFRLWSAAPPSGRASRLSYER